MTTNNQKISIIIPAYNEAANIVNTITELQKTIINLPLHWEIIVVNDHSTDATLDLIKDIPEIKIINHPYNKGYGAALKTGAKAAQSDWLLFFDADGQHRPEYLATMIQFMSEFDLISGNRIGYRGPWIRQPGKGLIHLLAIYLLGKKIPDFNCGLRLIKKKEFLRFASLLPEGFSCSTTTIFAFLKEGLDIKFIPLTINKRQGGKSRVGVKDFVKYLMLIMRLIALFSPLRIFLPVSFVLLIVGLEFLIVDLSQLNISESTVFLLISALLIFLFGLVADQIAAVRREINRPN